MKRTIPPSTASSRHVPYGRPSTVQIMQDRAALVEKARDLESLTPRSEQQEIELSNLLDAIEMKDRELEAARSDDRRRADSAIAPGQVRSPASRRSAAFDLVTPEGRRLEAKVHGEPLFGSVRSDWDGVIGPGASQPSSEYVSIGRMIKASALGDWSGAEAERAYLHEAGATMQTNGNGGLNIPEGMSGQIIDLARNKMRVSEAGAISVRMPLPSLSFAAVRKDPDVAWRGEGEKFKVSDATFGRFTLSSRTVACIVLTTIELLEDAGNMEAMLRDSIASAIALQWDYAALFGKGVGPEPTGLFYDQTVRNVVAPYSTSDPTVAQLSSLFSRGIGPILAANAEYENISWIWNSDFDLGLDEMMTANGEPVRFRQLEKSKGTYVSNQIPSTPTGTPPDALTSIAVGDFSQMVLGIRSGLTIEASRVASVEDDSGTTHHSFSRGLVAIRAYMRGDIGIVRPQHFSKVTLVPTTAVTQ